MKIRTLKFSARTPGDKPIRSQLELGNAQNFEKAKEQILPVAYLLRLEDLARLREFKDLIVDRGTKHKAKSLSKLLLGHGKVPLIDGNFSDSGQLRRSIRTLLANGLKKDERNLYIIGAKEALFNELWDKADEGNGKKEIADISLWLLHELMDKCEVPPELSERYVGKSEAASLVRQLIILAAQSEDPVLILGDTGTGKEVVAREIHRNSSRKGGKFITVNCSGIPRDLLESELFGHVKGAFTDAKFSKRGLWKIAGDGTLFLDEIGDLHLEHQAKILRALEDGMIRRVGSTEPIRVKARVIAATNRDLFSMVQAATFREDLYYRLRGFLIRTPALREHTEDIPLLAQFFWRKITRDDNKALPQEILDELQSYSWPGNARELKMVLNNLRALFGTDGLRVEHLRAVFYLEGQSSVTRERLISEKEITLHRAECLRHLKRVHEVIHTISSVQTSLRLRFHELERLTDDLLELLRKDVEEAKKYGDMEVAEAFGRVMSTIENVLGKA